MTGAADGAARTTAGASRAGASGPADRAATVAGGMTAGRPRRLERASPKEGSGPTARQDARKTARAGQASSAGPMTGAARSRAASNRRLRRSRPA